MRDQRRYRISPARAGANAEESGRLANGMTRARSRLQKSARPKTLPVVVLMAALIIGMIGAVFEMFQATPAQAAAAPKALINDIVRALPAQALPKLRVTVQVRAPSLLVGIRAERPQIHHGARAAL